MSTENTTVSDIDDAAAEKQLLAGFGGENIDEPTERPAGDATPTEATPAAEPKPVEPEYAQITKAQFDELMGLRQTLEKQFGTAFGKIGGIERWRSDMEAQVAQANELRAKITDSQIEALRKSDFSEHADALDILRKIPVVPMAPSADIDKLVNERVEKALSALPEVVDKQVELRTLTKMHPDWVTVKDEPGFAEFRSKLPKADQDKLATAWDADYVGGVITKYKASKSKTPTPKVEDLDQRRANRMAAGSTPSGSGAATPTSDPESELMDGFTNRRVGN